MSQTSINYQYLFNKDSLNFDEIPEGEREDFQISTHHGPEDILIQTQADGSKRLIISCAKRKKKKRKKKGLGFIDFYDLSSNIMKADSFELVSGEEYAPEKMRPHGIALATIDGQDYLYVISHEKGKVHRILQFKIYENKLIYQKDYGADWTKEMEPVLKPNDLFVTNEGDIYFTNPLTLGRKKKQFIGFISKEGACKQIITGLKYPNGIIVLGEKLYYTTSKGKNAGLYELTLKNKNSLNSKDPVLIAKIPGGDNIIALNDHLLTIAYHPRMGKLIAHALFDALSPSAVALVDLKKPASENQKEIFNSNGKFISGSSTALIDGGFLYVSQVIKPYIIKVPLPEND